MKTPWFSILAFVVAGILPGCGADEHLRVGADASTDQEGSSGGSAGAEAGPPQQQSSHASSVALTADDRFAIALNRTQAVAGIFEIRPEEAVSLLPRVVPPPAIRFDPGSEPWVVVTSPIGDTAYVVLRTAGEVVRIAKLSSDAPAVDGKTDTGVEPTGLAISPNGAFLYVANWGDGTMSVIRTADMTLERTIDLNEVLAASGILGVVSSRRGLAHPRALVVTNDGDVDDDDETVYVTEFFSQERTGFRPEKPHEYDVSRQGIVYVVPLAAGMAASYLTIAPVADTGSRDSSGCITGCFPNLLFAAALHRNRLFVTATCASPVGPVGAPSAKTIHDAERCSPPARDSGAENANFQTVVHSAVFVLDTEKRREVLPPLLLPREFRAFYEKHGSIDGLAPIPLTPVDIAFQSGTDDAYIVAAGSDAIFRARYRADGSLLSVGDPTERFINLYPRNQAVPKGLVPSGIAIARGAAKFAIVANEATRNVSLVDMARQRVLRSEWIDDIPEASKALAHGQWLFSTGRERWSHEGRTWGSCATCHVDGWTDGVTWFFARGPRQTPALDGTYEKGSNQRRIMNWTAVFDEVHDLEVVARGVVGGVGGIVWREDGGSGSAADRVNFDGTPTGTHRTATPQNGLNGSAAALMKSSPALLCAPDAGPCNSTTDEWNDIDAFVRAIRSPRAPADLASGDIPEGRKLFEAGRCAACHGGAQFTISRLFYSPGETNNRPDGGLLRTTFYTLPGTGFPPALNPPAAEAGTAPLRYVGLVAGDDQINCVLRNVGTFPQSGDQGVVADGGASVLERRQNMIDLAQGQTGYNPPSLLGVASGAPYFHAGNARTLEELFDEVFAAHHTALAPGFLGDAATRATEVRQLVAFLLSIDSTTLPVSVPVGNLMFDPDLCKAIPPGVVR